MGAEYRRRRRALAVLSAALVVPGASSFFSNPQPYYCSRSFRHRLGLRHTHYVSAPGEKENTIELRNKRSGGGSIHSIDNLPPSLVAEKETEASSLLVSDDSISESIVASPDEDAEDGTLSDIPRLLSILVMLKEEVYARLRQAFADLVTIIKRSTQKTEAWVRDDAMGQLVSSALALVAFFAAVAAFAVWNIEVLGGKKFSGPAEVIVPTVRVPQSSTPASSGVKFQKPKWKAPVIRTSYKDGET